MPTADPSLLPNIVSQGAGLFTANWSTILAAVIAITVVVKLPALVASGVIKGAFHSLGKVLRISK